LGGYSIVVRFAERLAIVEGKKIRFPIKIFTEFDMNYEKNWLWYRR
jgi:hypothetical protein